MAKREFSPIGKRVRMSAEQRREQIVEAAISLITRYGSYGFSMQSLADAVGLTLPGLNHYVTSRESLLSLIIERYYDATTDVIEPLLDTESENDGTPVVDSQLVPSETEDRDFPETMRAIIRLNAERPELVALFTRLAVEAADPHHPAHDFYVQRHGRVLSTMMAIPWRLPEPYRTEEKLHDLIVTAFFVMDGVQVQSLTNPEESLIELWKRAEPILFPSPIWDGYR